MIATSGIGSVRGCFGVGSFCRRGEVLHWGKINSVGMTNNLSDDDEKFASMADFLAAYERHEAVLLYCALTDDLFLTEFFEEEKPRPFDEMEFHRRCTEIIKQNSGVILNDSSTLLSSLRHSAIHMVVRSMRW